jgi:hypothetical protein
VSLYSTLAVPYDCARSWASNLCTLASESGDEDSCLHMARDHISIWSSPVSLSLQGDHHDRPAADMLDHKSFSLVQNAQALLAPGFDQGQVGGPVGEAGLR